MSKVDIAAAAASLARVAANDSVDHRELLAAAEHVVREIETAFYVNGDDAGGFEVATIGDRIYYRVSHDRIVGWAWSVDGRLLLEKRDRRLEAEIRILSGEDPFRVVHEIDEGISQVASVDQLKTFANDLPLILQSFARDYPGGHIVGELAIVVTALQRAYQRAGVVVWDWPAAGETTARVSNVEPDSHDGPNSP